MKAILKNSIIMLLMIVLLTGCSTNNEEADEVEDAGSVTESTEEEELLVEEEAEEEENVESIDLEGHSLLIFCGAGMKNPFEKIAEQFEEQTGCEVQVTYGNAAQIHTQISTTEEGDFFIAGSEEEVKPVEDFVLSSKDLVEHIPVLVVKSGNPKDIKEPVDLSNDGVKFIMGDPQATPIGKIANKVISDFELEGKVDIVANTATAPAMVIALEAGEADVGLVWKENIQTDKLEIVNSKEMDAYIKTIPAVMLSGTSDEEAQKAFNDYLDSQDAKDIWIEFGYNIIE